MIAEFRAHGHTTLETRQSLMVKAFLMTAAYDAAIVGYFSKVFTAR